MRAKTRMVLFLCFSFAATPAAYALTIAAAPPLKCAVDNPIGRSSQREAQPREAGRIAARLWRDVEQESNNKTMSRTWIQRFKECADVAGLSVDELVGERLPFRHLAVRTLQNMAESLRKSAENKDPSKEIEILEDQLAALRALDPEFFTEEKTAEYSLLAAEVRMLADEHKKAQENSKAKKTAPSPAEPINEKNRPAGIEKCTNKDFSSRLGMVRNQTDIGWCYAFAAAELVTYKLGPSNTHTNRRVSATDMAFLYNREFQREKAQAEGVNTGEQTGGVESKALKASLKHGGYCLEKNSPSEDFAYGLLKETINEVEKFKLRHVEREFSDEQLCFAFNRTTELFPNLRYQDFEEIIKVIGDRNLEYFEKLNDKNCGEQRKKYGLNDENIHQIQSTEGKNGPAVLAAIDEQLDKGNISAVAFPFSMISTSDSGGHSVTLVGRRFNEKTNTCEYLLRNSWGLSCGGALKRELCAPEHPGHLWVSRETMEKNLWRVTYIE